MLISGRDQDQKSMKLLRVDVARHFFSTIRFKNSFMRTLVAKENLRQKYRFKKW